MLVVFGGVLAATIRMAYNHPDRVHPDQDNDSLFVNLQAAQGTSYYDMAKWGAAGLRIVTRSRTSIRSRPASAAAPAAGGPGGGGGRREWRQLFVQRTPRATRESRARSKSPRRFRPQRCDSPFSVTSSGLPPSAADSAAGRGNQNSAS
jgi:multidrug efflux pump subunit AcrB